MFQLLIVDDEIESLEWLVELFENCEEEIAIYTASRSRKALELLDEIKFDIVLTDIQMPGMNGLELYEKIKEKWSHIRIVFLTGYSTHDILYQVTQDKNIRYLLKTESPNKIVQTVLEVHKELLEEQEAALKQRQNEVLLSKAKYWLEKGVIDQLVHGLSNPQSAKEQLQEMRVAIDINQPVALFLIRINSESEEICYGDQEYIFAAVQENMPRMIRMTSYILDFRYLIVIAQPKLSSDLADWNTVFRVCGEGLESVKRICGEKLGIQMTAAIYRGSILLEELGVTYHLLRRKLVPLVKEKEEGILFISPTEDESNHMDGKTGAMQILRLENILEQGKINEVCETLQEVAKPLLAYKSMHDLEALEIYYSISTLFIRYINVNDWAKKIPFQIGMYPLTSVEDFRDWSEAVDYLMRLAHILSNLMGEDEFSYRNQAIQRVEQYIQDHLQDDLSLQVLADVGNFNTSYLSRIFKQKYHCNLSDYIVKARITLAKDMLTNTNEKIYLIAEKVGYGTISSFNRVFRKLEGMSPAEYRDTYHINR